MVEATMRGRGDNLGLQVKRSWLNRKRIHVTVKNNLYFVVSHRRMYTRRQRGCFHIRAIETKPLRSMLFLVPSDPIEVLRWFFVTEHIPITLASESIV